jgi:autotransporter-associated beta strand protein
MNIIVRRARLALAVASVNVLSVSTAALAASDTWLGGTSGTWSDATNWDGTTGNAPPVTGDSLTFAGTSANTTTNNDIASLSLGGITFNAGADPYTLNGNGVALTGPITNNSSSLHTIAMPLSFAAAQTFTGGAAASSGLMVTGAVTNTATTGTTTLTLGGFGSITNQFVSSAGSALVLAPATGSNWTILNNSTNTANTVAAGSIQVGNGGVLSLGTATSAPSMTFTINTPGGDHTVGNATAQTATLSVVNGFLNVRTRMNTRNGDVNVSGGQLQIWNQFQVANSSLTEVSNVSVSGGLLDVRNGSGSGTTGGTLFVASRGTGTLTITGGEVRAGTLDVSRGAQAPVTTGGVQSQGVVNLDGGLLTVNNVSNATANIATPANAAGTTSRFNFNGGTLKARAAQANFLRSNSATGAVAPPVNYVVRSGGAIIDSNSFAIGAVEPLQHEAALGSTPDGGLTKLSSGTLTLNASTLAAVSTYTGPTKVKGGTLALVSAPSNNNIASSSQIIIGTTPGESAAVLDVQGITAAGGFTLGSTQTLSGFGKVIGATTIAGTLAPGGSIGTVTVDGTAAGTALTLAGSALLNFELNNSFLSDQVALVNGGANDIIFNDNTINFSDLAGGALASGQYTLFTANVATAYAGLTEDGSGNITAGLVVGSGLAAYPGSNLQQVGNNIVLNVAVPEPSALAALGAAGMIWAGRRRRQA